MTSVTKIEQIYKSGNEELAIQLLDTLTTDECKEYLLEYGTKHDIRKVLKTNSITCIKKCMKHRFRIKMGDIIMSIGFPR